MKEFYVITVNSCDDDHEIIVNCLEIKRKQTCVNYFVHDDGLFFFSNGCTSMQDLGLLQDQFTGVSNTCFLQIILNIVQPFLSWLSNRTYSFCDILKHFLQNSLPEY